jgi:predicted transcriptional regulator
MAMNLRLSDDEAELLRQTAEKEHRSMNDVVRLAIMEYVQRRTHGDKVRSIASEEIERWGELLDRLRDS